MFELIAAQWKATPDAVAIADAATELTCAQLAARVYGLAERLRAAGVGRESFVGVACEPSVEQVIAVLGVLAAGGAYVPLDPEHPAERLSFLVGDAGVELVVAGGVELGEIGARVLRIDDTVAAPSALRANPADALVVLYTSGSTGLPKGVVCTHAAFTNRLRWQQERFPYAAGEVGSARTSLGFVDSVAEILAPLAFGVPLIVVDGSTRRDPIAMIEQLAARAATRIVLVPTLLAAMLDVMPDLAARAPSIRMWFVGGEPVPVALVERFRRRMPGRKLINIYGATELSGDATCFDFDDMPPGLSNSPIGTALTGVHVRILDEQLAEATIGEVCVSGVCVARGYLGRPDLARARFVPNPFPEGGVLYRTGDVGRWLPSGDVEYLGRRDQLVKIRGMRVELGEVEAQLARAPDIGVAAVIARPDPSGELQLVAFHTGGAGAGTLRDHLEARLPGYMVPSRFVSVPDLPRNANGKVDRVALAERALDSPSDGAAPRGNYERRLAEIWSDVLGCPGVGRNHSFYELGGTSLGAVRIVAKLRDELRLDVPIAAVFEHPTVAQLAAYLEDLRVAHGAAHPLRVSGRPTPPVMALSYYQLPFWFFRAITGDVSVVNDIFGFEFTGAESLDLHRLQAAYARTVAAFDTLWMRYPRWRPVQCLADRRDVGFDVVDHRDSAAAPEQLLRDEAARNSTRRFDLERPPHVHGRLVRLAGGDDRLLIAIPHVAVDMTGMEMFRDALQRAYLGLPAAEPARATLADVVRWERGASGSADRDYWDTVGTGPAVNSISMAWCSHLRSGQRVRAFSSRALSARFMADLQHYAHQRRSSPAIVLVAAIEAGIGGAFELAEPTLLLMVEKRDRPETRALFGTLAAMMRFRASGCADLGVDARVDRVGEQLLRSYARSDQLMRRPTLFNDFWRGAPRTVRRALAAASRAMVQRWPEAELDADVLAEYASAMVPRPTLRASTHRDVMIAVNVMPEVSDPEPRFVDGFRVVRARSVDQILRPGDLVIGSDALLTRTLQVHLSRERDGGVAINLYGGGIDPVGLEHVQACVFDVLGRLGVERRPLQVEA